MKLLNLRFLAAIGLFFGFSISTFAQTIGDYRTNGAGTTWTTAANWDRWSGVAWVAGVSYPGQVASLPATTVTVQNGHTMNITATIPNSIVSLVVGGGTSGTLTVGQNTDLSLTLTCSGTVSVLAGAILQSGGNTGGTHTLNFQSTLTNNGTISNAVGTDQLTITVTGTTDNNGTLTFGLNNGIKTFTGLVTNTGSWTSTALATTGNLVFRSGVTNNGTFAAGGATFSDASSNAQAIGGTAAMSFSGVVTLSDGANAGVLIVSNTNTNTVAITGTGAAQLTGTAGAIWRQGSGSALSYSGTTITTITFDATTNSNTVTYTNTTAPTTIVSFSSLTYAPTGAATLTLASPNIAGNLTVTSPGSFAATGTTTFNGSSTQTVSGTGVGTISFANITLSTTGASNVSVTKSISVSGTIAWSANGLIVLGSNADITLTSAATITSPNASRYIQVDGSTGSNSNLIKTTTAATSGSTSWAITYPIGTATGGYTPVTLSTIATAPTLGALLSIKAIFNNSNQGQLRRQFRIVVSGNSNATTLTGSSFSYNSVTDVSSGDALANYSSLWFLASNSGSWTNPTGTAPGVGAFSISSSTSLGNATYYYTIGQSTAYPNTWYSYQTGVWSDWQNWTLDPSGSSLVNGLNLPPQAGDEIVILNGITITNDVSGQVASATTINAGATLDMAATTGNTLGTVSGTGLLRINGVALPTGTYTSFVASTGGTIEYYNTGGTLPTSQTIYNNLLLSTTSTSPTFITGSGAAGTSLTVNGTFNITSTGAGLVTWQINDATANQRTITLTGNVTVSANGAISVGTGAPTSPHTISMAASFTNNGNVRLFNNTAGGNALSDANWTSGALYDDALAGYGTVVTFTGTNDATVTCNGITYFYRFILNKGTGTQAILTLNSSSTTNFRLYGPNNLGSNATTDYSNCALSLQNGTLQMTGSISIPSLIENATGINGTSNDNFGIPVTTRLWLNSANVSVTITANNINGISGNDDQRVLVEGILQVTNGTVTFGNSKGMGSGDAGSVIIEGGTVIVSQIRPRAGSPTQAFSYIQSGGTVNVGTTGFNSTPSITGIDNTGYGRISIPVAGSTFQMSGGILNIGQPTSNGTGGGIQIASSASNYSVTGGTINAYIPSTGNNFTISSTAPINNLNIYREGTGAALISQLLASLVVLNNFTIITGNTPTFNCNSFGLTVGGNFTVNTSTTFTTGTNTVTFNGSGAQTLTNNGTISTLANTTIVMNKSAGTLTLAGSTSPVLPATLNNLTLTSGTLADGGSTVTVNGTLSNSAIHSGAGSIVLTNTGTGNLTSTIGGSGGVFGNLTIQTNASAGAATTFTVSTSGTQSITGNLQLNRGNANGTSTILSLASNALTVLGSISSNVSLGASYCVRTSGLHNAGGLTRQGAASDVLFPVGTGTIYTPITINATATTQGTITVRPVASEHPNVTTVNQSLQYYWRVTSSGYSGLSAATHKTYTFSSATKNGTQTTYRSARYDRSLNSWGTNNTTFDASAATSIPNFNTGTGWTGVTGDQLDGEYTCGNIGAFGTVVTYYSRQPGAWNVNATWSTVAVGGTAASSNPTSCATCPVVIGDGGSNNHTITIDANSRTCGSLTLSSGSTLDCSTFTGLNFGTNTGGTVTGTGLLRINSANFPAGDFTNFLGAAGGTVEWYGATKTIPSTGPAPQNLSLNTYFNLVINPSAANTITLPANNLTIFNNFTQGGTAGFTGIVLTNGSRAISITGNLAISLGTFNFSNANPSVTTLTVNGNTTIANGATMSTQGGGTANVNTFSTPGGITNNGTIVFNNTQTVNLTFTGTNNVSFTGTGSGGTTLSTVTVNKGSSQTPTVTFDVAGTVTAATSGWLTLTNGTFFFNNSGTYTLVSSAAGTYTIPSTARLRVGLGTVNVVTGTNTAADLILNGVLEVSGGTVNIGDVVNTIDNDIQYASAGLPNITVSSGNLNVNGSIRRSTTTITGALVYNQTGGTVTVRGRLSNNTRGVFEIDANTGSSFTLTGSSNLIIQGRTGGTSYADLFINPITSNVSTNSTISMGLNTGTAQSFSANIASSIGNFSVVGGGAGAQTVTLFSNPIAIGGNLSIATNTTLIANNLDVSIAGNLSITGTGVYNGGTNTTTFNGTTTQSAALSSGSTFTNMTINNSGGANVNLSGTAPNLTNLNILAGVLNVGTLALTVTGNITNNSSQIGTGSITMFGTPTAHTITSSNGSFTNLSLGGTAITKTVTVSGNLSILGTLDFTASGTSRYLFIGSSLLSLGSSATISNNGTTRFIKTNGVSSDLGVLKNFAVGTSTFTYAVGTRTNYTPVTFTSFVVTTAGSLTVLPVDDQHPTASPTGEQILSYYWSITKNSTLVHNATGSFAFQVPQALIGGSGGTLVGAYLDALNLIGWTAGGALSGTDPRLLTFSGTLNTFLPAVSGQFDYTYGTNVTLPNPVTPVYSRFADADGTSNPTNAANVGVGATWASALSWTLSSTGNGAPLSSIPTNRPVVILSGARINADLLGRRSFSTLLSGTLVVTTVGHSLGNITGTGTMRTTNSTLPAGNYTTFTSAGGGTIEYVAPMTMNSRTTYNNLSIFSGSTGTVTMTNTNLTINGNLTIPTGTTLNNANNNNISIAGNWSNSGTFTPGTGTVTFTGTNAQTVSGSTTFNNVTLNKATNTVTLSGAGATNVSNNLTLTSGYLVSSATNTLALGSATVTGGSSLSFVAGPITKTIAVSGSFTAPLGRVTGTLYRPASIANTNSADSWQFEYVGASPTTGGYSNKIMNTANLGTVSVFEYWLVSRSGATTADLTLSYNTGSYVPPDIGTVANLRVARWDGTQWDLPPGGGAHSQSGTNTAGTVSVTNVTNFSPVTLASTDLNSPLPVTFLNFDGRIVPAGVELKWRTATEINNRHFTIEKSITGEKFDSIGQVAGKGTSYTVNAYQFVDENPVEGKVYYRLRQTDFDGSFAYSDVIAIEYYSNRQLKVAFYPNPIENNSALNIEASGLVGVSELPFTIVDQLGKVQVTDSMKVSATGFGSHQIELANLPNGVYLITLGNSNKIVKRVVISR